MYYSNELYHHGVKGQHWGKRNGPPYPLYRKSAYYKKTGQRPPGYNGNKKGKSDSGGTNKSGRVGGLKDIKRAGDTSWVRKKYITGRIGGIDDSKSEKKNHNKSSIGKNIRDKLINRYQEQYVKLGLSKKEAKKMANKKYETTIKGLKAAGIAVGVAAGATLAYKGIRHFKAENIDEVYKKGTKIQTMSLNPNRQLDETFYGAHRMQDKLQYRGMANNLKGPTGWHTSKDGAPPKVYRLNSVLTEDVKLPSNKNARKVFNELRLKDPEFKAYTDKIKTNFDAGRRGKLKYLKKTDAYGAFNRDALMYGYGDSAQNAKFFNAIKKKGYAGLKDVNDRQLNTYHTDANIWFGKSDGYLPKMKQLKTVDADYGKTAKRMMRFNMRRRIAVNNLARGGVVVGAAGAGGAGIASRRFVVNAEAAKKANAKKRRRKRTRRI